MLRCSAPATASDNATSFSSNDLGAGEGRRVAGFNDDVRVWAVVADADVSAGFDVVEAADGMTGLKPLEKGRPSAAVIEFLRPV